MLPQSSKRDAALGDSTNGSAATIYRASLIARVAKFPLLVLPQPATPFTLGRENRGMAPFEIENLDNDAMNGRVAGLVSRYWHRQGYTVEVGTNGGPVWSNLRYGLPLGY